MRRAQTLAFSRRVRGRACARIAVVRRAARRNPARPGARSARAHAVARTALHGVPEPVDRRFGCAAGARPAVLVRERLKAGDSDTQVLDFLTARYGEFVLLKPRFGWDTALLWLAPAGVLLAGVWRLGRLCCGAQARQAPGRCRRRAAGADGSGARTSGAASWRWPAVNRCRRLNYLNIIVQILDFPRLPKINLAATPS